MNTGDYELVVRAAYWYGGKLPAYESLERFIMQVHGPRDEMHNDPTTYHTFACLYPELGLYLAADTARSSKPAEWNVTADVIRERINGFEPPEHHILHQRQLAAERMPGSTAAMRWDAAVMAASLSRLPVAMVAFGHTVQAELVVYQQSVVLAPLAKVSAAFKRAAPRINLN